MRRFIKGKEEQDILVFIEVMRNREEEIISPTLDLRNVFRSRTMVSDL